MQSETEEITSATTPRADFPVEYSHRYTCGRCGGPTGMYGHYRGAHRVNGRWVKVMGHICCPGNCELNPDHEGDSYE